MVVPPAAWQGGPMRSWRSWFDRKIPQREINLSDPQIATLQRVGFWWSTQQPNLPHPQNLVDQSWDVSERDRAITYLEECYHLTRICCGYSWCRFECGIASSKMGNLECTDGVWLFPDGFIHYVRYHGVKPPEKFLMHMRKANYTVRAIY